MASELSPFGWTPGNYWFVCRDCRKKQCVGSKRSWRCEDCAKVAAAKWNEPDTRPAPAATDTGLVKTLRDTACAIVDAIHRYTWEFSPNPTAHKEQYDLVEKLINDLLAGTRSQETKPATDTGLGTVEADDIPGCPACGHAGRTGNVICDICTPVKDATGKCGKLETVGAVRQETIDGVALGQIGLIHPVGYDQQPIELVTRSQAEELLAAERAESDEAYELGKRDGYSEAVQEIDLKTGGDGEYRYCTDHDPERHTPDPASMIQRIVERFETLNTMESISEINEWKERAEKAEADNAAQAARIKELEDERYKLAYAITGGEDAPGYLDSLSVETLVEVARDNARRRFAETDRAEALEAKLAAAQEALEPFADHAKERAVDASEWRDTDTVQIVVTIGDLRKARAVLGGKP